MNKLKMAAVQERLKLKRVQIDTWTTREKLCLASAVLRSGDQNWVSVSRTLRAFDELNRPPDWFSQKNCALQYSSLLEKVDTPKRKRGERGEVHVETPGESIVRKLTSERVDELKKSIEMKKSLHRKLQDEIALVRSGQADDKLDEMLQEIEEEKRQKKREAEIHAQWLKEREEKLLEIKRAWKPPAVASSASAATSSPHQQRDPESGTRQSSSQSEQSSEAESLLDSPLSEPLQVDVIGDESLEEQVEVKPSSPVQESSPPPNSPASSVPSTPTPTSPLLTSLLKSPSQAPSLQASSILHTAITAQRGSSPTITSLLNSSPAVPVSGTVAVSPSVSAGIKNLVTSAISSASTEEHSEKPQPAAPSTTSPSAGAPTLSMLLELPPSLPGKPLPEIPSLPPPPPSVPKRESAPTSPIPSPPASPQPTQESLPNPPETLELVPVKEEEEEEEEKKEKEDTAKPDEENVSSDKQEKQVETTTKDSVETNERVDDLSPKPEKPDDETSAPVLEVTTVTKSLPETISVAEETNVPQVPVSTSDNNEEPEVIPCTKPSTSESVEENVESSVTTEAEEIEPASDKKSLTDVPHTKFPEKIEVAEVNISETKAEEVINEPSEDEKASTAEVVEKNVSTEIPPLIDTSKISEELQTAETTEENVEKSSEIRTENSSLEEIEKKTDVKEVSEKVTEVIEDVIKEEKQPPANLDSKPVDEPSPLSESTEVTKKEEGAPESAAEEEDVTEKSPIIENLQSSSESTTPDSQLKRRGGGRGRKFRGRALALYRMRQERKAREKLAKAKGELRKTDSGSENNPKESEITPVSASEDSLRKDKTETKMAIVADSEISNLKSEWDEDATEDAVEEEKRESGISQKKIKGKKIDEATDENKQKTDNVQSLDKPKVETVVDVAEETKKTVVSKTEKDANNKEEKHDSEVSKENEGEKSSIIVKEGGDKKTAEAKIDDKQLKKGSETKKIEEGLTEPESLDENKLAVERKAEDKKISDKKSENKAKQMPSDKKLDDKERKRLKDYRIERKDKKVDGEKKDEDVVIKEEGERVAKEEEKKVSKEKRIEGKDRKSLAEKRVEVGDKKQVKEKKSEEREEKSDVEKRATEKGTKEPEVKKPEGERKMFRERKSEEKEKKAVSERKVEDNKRKSVDEKKTEEVERSKSTEKEVVVSSKKSVTAPAPDKSKALAVMAVSNSDTAEKQKRKIETVEEEINVSDKNAPSEAKQVKRTEEVPSVRVGESDKEKNESERKVEEESAAKRKVERRKGILSRRLDMEEGASKGVLSAVAVEDKEKTNEGEWTPKSNFGRRRGGGSMSISSAPGTPLDQVPSSPASSQSLSEEERDYRAWKKAILLVWSRLATHKFASIFLRPITNDQAPGYHNVVFRSVDLYTVKKNVENGVIRTTAHFQRDVMLMFLNAIMYNSSDHDVHRMSVQMQQESLQHIQILLEASEAPKILRRETREGNKRSDSSSQMHLTSTSSHDEASAGVTASSISSHTPGISSVSAVPSSSNSVSSSSLAESSTVTDAKVGGNNKEGGTLAARDREATPSSSKRKRGSTFGSVQHGEEKAAKKQRVHRTSAAAEDVPIVTSEEEMSESESQLSYIMSRQKVGDSGDFSGAGSTITPIRFQKDELGETSKKKKIDQEVFLLLDENNDAGIDGGSSAENSNSSDNEDEKMDIAQSMTEASCMSKKDVTKEVKDGKHSTITSLSLDQCHDPDMGDEQLSSSQFGDHEQYVDDMEKKQVRRRKRSINECLISSEDSCSIPDDGGYWPNVMSIKEEKADDAESVTSSVYKRRRVQRKSTNSDHDSLTDAPNFPFSPNSASLEESDYQAWKRLVLLIWDQLADHEFATIFMTPVRTDEAPRYYNVVYRPMDLGTIRKNVEKGLVRTISHFQRDVMLMFANALMYNPSHHDVHHKTAQMQKECLQYLQLLVQESSEDPEVFRHEIREANNKVHSTGLDDITTVASKSDSPSSEDQLSYNLTSGKVSVTGNSVNLPSLKGNLSILYKKDEKISTGKMPANNVRSSPAFSTRKRTSTYDSV